MLSKLRFFQFQESSQCSLVIYVYNAISNSLIHDCRASAPLANLSKRQPTRLPYNFTDGVIYLTSKLY
jgi:hypothetical protein